MAGAFRADSLARLKLAERGAVHAEAGGSQQRDRAAVEVALANIEGWDAAILTGCDLVLFSQLEDVLDNRFETLYRCLCRGGKGRALGRNKLVFSFRKLRASSASSDGTETVSVPGTPLLINGAVDSAASIDTWKPATSSVVRTRSASLEDRVW